MHKLSEPMLLVTCTAVGFTLGYFAHRYEENSEARVQRLLEKHRHVPPHDNWTRMGRRQSTKVRERVNGVINIVKYSPVVQ